MLYDTLIRNGLIYDGRGGTPYIGSIALLDGKIAAMGQIKGHAKEEIDASGFIVTPGFIDLHTHYDGQVSWDDKLEPSVYHGVTTVVLGNCGVGFAPVHKEDRERLIRLMEGVEDIPGTALHEGIQWNWESFPEYMDALEQLPHTLDFALYVPHDPLRVYVMRDRGIAEEHATRSDIEQMKELLREALDAGAVGFSTGRSDVHRTADGEWTPASEASQEELVGLATAFDGVSHGILQAVSDFNLERGMEHFDEEFALIEAMATRAKKPFSISLVQRDFAPNQWRQIIAKTEEAAKKGTTIHFQVAPRGIGIMLGLKCTFHPLMAFPSYLEIAHLPLSQRLKELQDPERKAKILSEKPISLAQPGSSVPPLADVLLSQLNEVSKKLFRLGNSLNYEQDFSRSIYVHAQSQGVSVMEAIYDALLANNGENFLYFPIYNYTEGNLKNVREMLLHPHALLGLSDGGAHVGTICDASFPVFLLTHWTRDRQQGKLPVEWAIHFLSLRSAEFLGLQDRGELAVGKKADINIIDYQNLRLEQPLMVDDLPASAQRLMQKSQGIRATFVAGQKIQENGSLTTARPGRLIRFGQADTGA